MTQSAHEGSQTHMGLPLSHGKLAMWFFLVTEIMFFTALIGVYIILRNGTPASSGFQWPTPEQMHLKEWIGAVNTFVLICSSVTVVLAHYVIAQGKTRQAMQYVAMTFVLGLVFLGIKAYEYHSKFEHDILPGHIGEVLPGRVGTETAEQDEEHFGKFKHEGDLHQYHKQYHPVGMQYYHRIQEQLDAVLTAHSATAKNLDTMPEHVQACYKLKEKMSPQTARAKDGKDVYVRPISPAELGAEVNHLNHKYEDAGLHLTPSAPFGNLWASCYFAMTGFHALHVLGGIVIFAIILIMGFRGRLGKQHTSMLELTGLYWHFVDIVWIFLFPLLYLV
jgi:cytochrome c oxidase subunit 3